MTETTISDTQTTTAGDDGVGAGVRQPAALVISVLYHPDVRRIGDRFAMPWRLGASVSISRRGPVFSDQEGRGSAPLLDRGLSRRPVTLICTRNGLRIEPDKVLPYRLGGASLDRSIDVGSDVVARGIMLECARRVLLWIDVWSTPPFTAPVGELWGISAAADRLRARIASLAPHEMPVALAGESGTGKELVARALHAGSKRAGGPCVTVNVGALNPSTAAAELFGHARGAFTGADQARPGFFRRANRGTLFLDEIGSLPEAMQPMLLRALESGEIQPVGEASRRVDVRLLTATDADLDQLSAAGRFFGPLLYRIRTTRIALPPLRDRVPDISLLFVRFVAAQLESLGRSSVLGETEEPWLPRRIIELLLQHRWPGNVRELRNLAVQTALESADEPHARLPSHFEPRSMPAAALADPISILRNSSPSSPLNEVAGRGWAVPPEALREALQRHGWRVRPVASELGIARNTVYAMMGRLGIRRPSDLTRDDVMAAIQATQSNDTARLADHLQVSERGLKLRLRALSLSLD